MHGVAKDFRFAFRQLWKAPGFTLIVVLMLGLGIGITTAIFSLIEGILLRPLPFRDPGRLVLVGDHLGNNLGIGVTAREIATYSHASGAFSSMGGFTGTSYELSGGATPEEVSAGNCAARTPGILLRHEEVSRHGLRRIVRPPSREDGNRVAHP